MLLDEVEQVQNPGLGAAIIWQFVRGYSSQSDAQSTPLIYAFLVMPILFNRELLDNIASTHKGVRKLEEKLSHCQSSMVSLQESALGLRELSRKALLLAIASGLIELDPRQAILSAKQAPIASKPDTNTKKMLKAAEKLGNWAGAISHREFCFIFHLEI